MSRATATLARPSPGPAAAGSAPRADRTQRLAPAPSPVEIYGTLAKNLGLEALRRLWCLLISSLVTTPIVIGLACMGNAFKDPNPYNFGAGSFWLGIAKWGVALALMFTALWGTVEEGWRKSFNVAKAVQNKFYHTTLRHHLPWEVQFADSAAFFFGSHLFLLFTGALIIAW